MTSPERAAALAVAVALLAVLATGCGSAGLLGTATTAATPTDDRPTELVEAWATRGGVPAATVVVRRAGAEIFRGAHAADTRQQFRVASITKLFVATVVMQLVDDGAVQLDDEVGVPIAGARPTVRQLLGHTSGIPDYGTEDFVQRLIDEPQHRWSEAAVLQTLAEQRPAFAPGADWEYSNSNYLALATVIQEATGTPWASVLRERILDPLGLDDTYVAGSEPPRGPGIVHEAFFDLDNDGTFEDVEDGPWPALETSESAAGALVSTAADVALFTEALFTGRIVSPETIRDMVSGSGFGRRYDDYGLGVELHKAGLQTLVWGHGGHLPGYRCVTWFAPETTTTVTVLANHSQANPQDLASQMLDVVP